MSAAERTCPRCGDPLPVDSRCDCAGDPDRNGSPLRTLRMAHATVVRLGPKTGRLDRDTIIEMWT